MGKAAPISKERRRDKLLGLAIIILAFGGCMLFSLWGLQYAQPTQAAKPAPPTKAGLPAGFPKKVKPLELIDQARALSERENFRGFVATRVKADGTIDLSHKKASIRYSFQSARGRGHQPPRPAATLPDRRFCGVQSVVVKKNGIGAREDDPDRSCPSDDVSDLPLPQCTLKDVWKAAKKKKISTKGTAKIEYFDSVAGPAYRFKKGKRSFVLSAKQCKKTIKGSGARGSVP